MPIPLFDIIDLHRHNSPGASILSLSAYTKIATTHELSLLPYDVELYAANGKSIITVGIAEDVSFQLGGHTLKTNFVVIADHIGSEDFIQGHNFLRTCNVLVELTAMNITIRDPKPPRIFEEVHEVSDQEASFIVSAEDVTSSTMSFLFAMYWCTVVALSPTHYLFQKIH